MNPITFAKPTQCHLWQKEVLEQEDLDFETIETFVDESHWWRLLRKCKRCGQLYFEEFYEVVVWDGGDDKIYSTYIPVDSAESARELHKLKPFDLLMVSPRLQWDSPRKPDKPEFIWV